MLLATLVSYHPEVSAVRFLIPVLVAALILVTFIAVRRGGGLVRGVAEEMLVSPARPSVAVRAAQGMRMVDARRADLSLDVQGSHLPGASAEVWYALYENAKAGNPAEPTEAAEAADRAEQADRAPGVTVRSAVSPEPPFPAVFDDEPLSRARLVALLAMVDSPYAWPPRPEQTLHVIRTTNLTMNRHAGVAQTFILPLVDDPWADAGETPSPLQYEEDKDPWRYGSLTRRFTFLLFQSRARLVVEYREPNLPDASGLAPADDLPRLAAFETRAEKAFSLLGGADVSLPKPAGQLPYPPAGVGRKRLASFVGDVWRPRAD